MTIPAYPLAWPAGWVRTPASAKADAKFRSQQRSLSVFDGATRVIRELTMMGIDDSDLVVSTNLKLRLDGFPRSDQPEPGDTGAAVYWRDSRNEGWPMRCMAIDRYYRLADNLAAIAATLEAMRSIERHGGAEILDRAFTGFTALPGPDSEHWTVVLGVTAHAATNDVSDAYRRLRSEHHPDRGGNAGQFNRVQNAFEQFSKERGL